MSSRSKISSSFLTRWGTEMHLVLALVAFVGCAEDDFPLPEVRPVAVIEGPSRARVGNAVTLFGVESYTTSGLAVTEYLWSIDARPEESNVRDPTPFWHTFPFEVDAS